MERIGHRPHLANPHESKKRMGKPSCMPVVSLFCCTTERKIRRMGLPIRRTVGQAFGAQPGPKARSIYGWTGYGETWNSESCAAGQPVLAVKTSLMFRAVVPAGRVKLTVLPVAGLNVYPAEGMTVV